jgi:two-component system OmpR family sensor kinase
VVALLAIAAAGFTALGVAGTHVVRGYVTDRAEAQLRETSADIGSTPVFIRSPGFGTSGEPERRAMFFYARSLPQGVSAQLRSGDGAFVREYGLTSWSGASGPLLPGDLPARMGRPFTVPARATSDHWRVLVTTPVEGSTLIVAANVTAADAAVGRLTETALIAGGLALAVMAFVGLRIARSGKGQLTEIESTVEAAVAGDLSRRVSVPADDTEPGQVAHAVNALIEQVGDAREAEERALRRVGEADRAVRLPLSVIKGFADYYRDAPGRDPARMARLVDRVDDEATRIGVVLEDLLADLSRSGNGHGNEVGNGHGNGSGNGHESGNDGNRDGNRDDNGF